MAFRDKVTVRQRQPVKSSKQFRISFASYDETLGVYEGTTGDMHAEKQIVHAKLN